MADSSAMMGSLSALVANEAVAKRALQLARAMAVELGANADAERTAKERATSILEVKNFILDISVVRQ